MVFEAKNKEHQKVSIFPFLHNSISSEVIILHTPTVRYSDATIRRFSCIGVVRIPPESEPHKLPTNMEER